MVEKFNKIQIKIILYSYYINSFIIYTYKMFLNSYLILKHTNNKLKRIIYSYIYV